MQLSLKQIQRAKDLAAMASSQAYFETLQSELRAMMIDCSESPHTLISIAGRHAHEAVAIDDHGNAVALLCTWELVTEPMVVASIVERSRHSGVG